MDKTYAIVIQKISAFLADGNQSEVLEVANGTLVEYCNERRNEQGQYCFIIICSLDRKDVAFEHNVYMCKKSALLDVPSKIWPFLKAIHDPFDRISVAKDKPYIDYILKFAVNSFITINGQYFNVSAMNQSLSFLPEREPKDKFNCDYDCIIRYIGPIDELGPGHYFGLELLNLQRGHSPQAEEIAEFSKKYIPQTDSNLCFLLPVNFVKKPNSKYLKRIHRNSNSSSVLESIICGFKDAVRPRHSTNYNNNSNSSSNNSSKRHSYIESVPDEYVASSSSSSSAVVKRPHTPDGTGDANVKMSSATTRFPSSISSPNLAKQDSGGSSSTASSSRLAQHDLIHFSEDYSKTVEERERKMEDRRMSGSRGTQTSSSSSTSGDVTRTPKTKKKTLVVSAGGASREIRPSTILRLEDRDLVVIDKQDIKEAVNSESDVIIVDPPALPPTPSENGGECIDLGDILGGAWPDSAGGAASLLNQDRKSITSVSSNNGWQTVGRNRSPNIASHFGGTHKPRRSTTSDDGHNGMEKYQMRKKQNGGQYENLDHDSIGDSIPEGAIPSPLIDIPGSSLGLGSLVEVSVDAGKSLHGVIRWIGQRHQQDDGKMYNGFATELVVGVELDEPCTDRGLRLTDGLYHGQRCFKCPEKRAIFVSNKQCTKDRRFHDEGGSKTSTLRSNSSSSDGGKAFGGNECPAIEGSVAALKFVNLEDLESQCGKFKGIQGHHNSCYLDATLFSMFTFTSVFDSLLFRPRDSEDCDQYEEVQRVLREEIVNPLRKNLFVRADRVLKLRQLLDKLSSVRGLINEEKDPEEFLNSLLAQILRAEPFLKLSSGLDAFFYQLFIEKDEKLSLPTVQQLFEQSFLTSDIKLKEVPSCLIIQMPRFGKNFKMYPRILPSQVLDVTDIIEDSPRQCTICGTLAEFECRDCFGGLQVGSGLESTAFCKKCLTTVHSHQKRVNHKPKALSIPHDYEIIRKHCEFNQVPRLFMELFAVICIETSHYVAFVKSGSGLDSPWVFFDSMADRKGERDGYNIPEMVPVPDLPTWLSEDGSRQLHEANVNDKHLPEFAKRLYCDAYLMLYQSTEMMMYR